MEADDVILDDVRRWLLGDLVDELVYNITNQVVTDSAAVTLEHSTQIGHSVMIEAIRAISASRDRVRPLLEDAREPRGVPEATQRAVTLAKSRPVKVESDVLLINGSRVSVCNADIALAYYDVMFPYRDIQQALLPVAPPDLSTQDKIYRFIGERLSDTIISARARLVVRAIRALTAPGQ